MKMMDSPELIILDVGHGNSAIVRGADRITIIDCASGTSVNDVIEELEIKTIDTVLISHGDQDHVGGLIQLLLNKNVEVRKIYINPDVPKTRHTKLWEDLRIAIADSLERASTKAHASLTTNESGEFDHDEVKFEILSPNIQTALTGAGGKSVEGKSFSSNTMSVVVRLLHQDYPIALFPADIDNDGLNRILADNKKMKADILMFPHHGGLPGDAKVSAR
jgi:beta-lactamase superfamily II metal-dependent hydrolase